MFSLVFDSEYEAAKQMKETRIIKLNLRIKPSQRWLYVVVGALQIERIYFKSKSRKRCQNMRRHTYTGKADPTRMIQVLPFFIISFLTSLDHLKKSQRHW